ncbi:MAG TPA: DUF58 domain-containing protein [Chthoniobacterales bacterium]
MSAPWSQGTAGSNDREGTRAENPPLPILPIDLALLASLPSLPLRAKYLVEGYLSGKHRSPLKGHSVEFVEYRGYQPGDELRHVDWRLYGRADRLHVKQFEEETRLRVFLLADTSGSMSYKSRPELLTKLDYARTLLAAVGMLAQRQRDAIGIALLGRELSGFQKPGSSLAHWRSILATLDTPDVGGVTRVSSCLETVAELLPRRSLLVVTSDLYEEIPALESALQRLRYDGHEVLALQVLDPMEVEFGDDEAAGTFLDLEDGRSLILSAAEVRRSYLENFRAHQAALRDLFAGMNFDLATLRTDSNPLAAISTYLARREHLL